MKLVSVNSALPSVNRLASSASPLQNDLLAGLSSELQNRLFPLLEQHPLSREKILYDNGDTVSHVYFPTDAIISLLYVLRDGASTEVSVVGKNGFVGIGLVMGSTSTPWTSVVQRQGNAFRLPAKALRDEFNRNGELLSAMLYYAQTVFTQVAQIAVCNRHHTVNQQFCRWLLNAIDLLSDTTLNVTHELIASKLGVRREGVTEAAGRLQKQGAITCQRGRIKVLNRADLERQSCECYVATQSEKDQSINGQRTSLRYA